MLRITTDRQGATYRIQLHGNLAGDGVDVLERHWRTIRERAPWAPVTVVVADVGFIDADGEAVLRRIADAGAEFEGSGIMNRYIIEKISTGLR